MKPGGDYLLVEAKAPSAKLGRRWNVERTGKVQQGTHGYVASVIAAMKESNVRLPPNSKGFKFESDLSKTLEKEHLLKNLEYILIQARVEKKGGGFSGFDKSEFLIY